MQLTNVALLALAGLAGCGAHVDTTERGSGAPTRTTSNRTPAEPVPTAGDTTAPPDQSEAVLAVDDNIARLRALDLFTVGELIVALPSEATNCYGICPGSEAAVAAAKAEAATKLAAFTDAAERAVAEPYDAYACGERIDRNLEALRALAIVEIGSFIRSQPTNNPECYNTPCPSDVAAADALDEARATDLESIVVAIPELSTP